MDVEMHLTTGAVNVQNDIISTCGYGHFSSLHSICTLHKVIIYLRRTRCTLVNGSEVDSFNRTINLIAFSTIRTVPATNGGRSHIRSLGENKN